MEKGTVWVMHFDNIINAKEKAVEIAKNLLTNENYQKFRVMK